MQLTIKEAARKLGISGTRVRLLCQQGRLESYKHGNAWVITGLKRKVGKEKR